MIVIAICDKRLQSKSCERVQDCLYVSLCSIMLAPKQQCDHTQKSSENEAISEDFFSSPPPQKQQQQHSTQKTLGDGLRGSPMSLVEVWQPLYEYPYWFGRIQRYILPKPNLNNCLSPPYLKRAIIVGSSLKTLVW